VQIILGDGAVVCGLPVVFESFCEKKGGGPDGQRNWLKGGRRNWKERHLRLTQRWLQYLDGPLPGGVVKGSKEVSQDWVVTFNSKHANAITIECGGDEVFNVRFSNAEVPPQQILPPSLSFLIQIVPSDFLLVIRSSVASGWMSLPKLQQMHQTRTLHLGNTHLSAISSVAVTLKQILNPFSGWRSTSLRRASKRFVLG
jgi:hypothetical protein